MESSNFKNKTIVADGGNSEGGAGAKYQGAKHPNQIGKPTINTKKAFYDDNHPIEYGVYRKDE